MTSDINPCPYCKGKLTIEHSDVGGKNESYYFDCLDCKSPIATVTWFEVKAALAINMFNERYPKES